MGDTKPTYPYKMSTTSERMGEVLQLTIVIPTFNEQENVRIIAARIRSVLAVQDYNYEILFVDDSRDHTPAVLAELAQNWPEVRYIHREGQRGLASAVVEGFRHARGQYIVVMDADLQHPPDLIPLIIKRLCQADVVIPSRFITGGSDGGLSPLRRLISWTARGIGRLFIGRLRHISDCTGGYFGINCAVVAEVPLDPIGWKILMEVLVKGKYQTIHEIPYVFTARDAGESKMNFREQWHYLVHVMRLVRYSASNRATLDNQQQASGCGAALVITQEQG